MGNEILTKIGEKAEWGEYQGMAQSDWNQNNESAPDYIKNRPFGTKVVPGMTIEWDGNTEGKEIVEYPGGGGYLCKVSNDIFPIEAIYGATVTGINSGNNFESILEESDIMDGATQNAPLFIATCPVSGLTMWIIKKDAQMSPTVTLTTGVYFMFYLTDENVVRAYIKSLTVTEYENIVRIEEKYLPEINLVGRTTSSGGEIFNNYAQNIATSSFSHAEGSETTASGLYSHAEGLKTNASGGHSHAEGDYSTASDRSSHAEGNYTTSSGVASHSEGIKTTASGDASHAEGSTTNASGDFSHTEGYETIAQRDFQHVQGKWNIADTTVEPGTNIGKYAHIVGNGNGITRSNAHTLDWSGNAWFAGTVEGTAMIVKSSTKGSTKKFKITVDDSGTISATEITI